MIREDLEKEYVGKCLEIKNFDKRIFYIVTEHVYVHSKDSIVFEGFGFSYKENDGLIRKTFESILSENEISTKIKVLTKDEFLKKLEWFYITDLERILNGFSETIDFINKEKDDTEINNK